MKSDQFRALLRQRLESGSDRILLRVLVPGRENGLMELIGPALCARSLELARRYCQAPPSGVVLLLLPHSAEDWIECMHLTAPNISNEVAALCLSDGDNRSCLVNLDDSSQLLSNDQTGFRRRSCACSTATSYIDVDNSTVRRALSGANQET
jgi:hypothetical protein